MGRTRLALPTLLIALAAGAVSVPAAGATEPDFETSGGNTFEVNGGSTTLQTRATFTMTCTSQHATGEVEASGSKNVRKVLMVLKGCVAASQKCQTFGAAAGEIVMREMVGELGYIAPPPASPHKVGLDLKPNSFGWLVIFECGRLGVQVIGSVIGEITPLGSWASSFPLTFTQSGGTQGIQHFSGALNDIPETALSEEKFEESGLAVADTLKPTGTSKIKIVG